MDFYTDRIRELEASLVLARHGRNWLKAKLDEARHKRDKALQENAELKEELSRAQRKVDHREAALDAAQTEIADLKAKLAQPTDQQEAKPKSPYSFRNRTALMATIQDFRKDQSDIRPFLEAFAKCLQHGDI